MTRLAIIFSLLFVTPVWAESKVIFCVLVDETENLKRRYFKYEEGFFYDSCYQGENGLWNEMTGTPFNKGKDKNTAKDFSCFLNHPENKLVIDFIKLRLTAHEGTYFCQKVE